MKRQSALPVCWREYAHPDRECADDQEASTVRLQRHWLPTLVGYVGHNYGRCPAPLQTVPDQADLSCSLVHQPHSKDRHAMVLQHWQASVLPVAPTEPGYAAYCDNVAAHVPI